MNESNALDRQAALLDVQGSQALIIHASMFMQLLAAQHAGNEKLASSFLPSYECSSCCGLTNSPSVYVKTKPIHEC
jgi:hypothetical protein